MRPARWNVVLASAVFPSLGGYIGYSRGDSSPAIPGVRGLGVRGEGGEGGARSKHRLQPGGRWQEGGRDDGGKSTLQETCVSNERESLWVAVATRVCLPHLHPHPHPLDHGPSLWACPAQTAGGLVNAPAVPAGPYLQRPWCSHL